VCLDCRERDGAEWKRLDEAADRAFSVPTPAEERAMRLRMWADRAATLHRYASSSFELRDNGTCNPLTRDEVQLIVSKLEFLAHFLDAEARGDA
jgi:hypothetical protein